MNNLDNKFRIYEGRTLKVPNMVKGERVDLALYCPEYAASREKKFVKAPLTVSEYQKKAEIAHKKREAELAEKARLAELASKKCQQELAQKNAELKAAKNSNQHNISSDTGLHVQHGGKEGLAEKVPATFALNSKLTLKENLEDWLLQAGGQLIWNAELDMEVTLDRAISTNLVEALEYISLRLHDYNLQFFAKNTTLVVTEK